MLSDAFPHQRALEHDDRSEPLFHRLLEIVQSPIDLPQRGVEKGEIDLKGDFRLPVPAFFKKTAELACLFFSPEPHQGEGTMRDHLEGIAGSSSDFVEGIEGLLVSSLSETCPPQDLPGRPESRIQLDHPPQLAFRFGEPLGVEIDLTQGGPERRG